VLEYPGHVLVNHVTDAGTFRFQQKLLYLANGLVDQYIGLEETALQSFVHIHCETGGPKFLRQLEPPTAASIERNVTDAKVV